MSDFRPCLQVSALLSSHRRPISDSARSSTPVDRAAGRLLGDVHDDGLRHDDGNIAVGNDIAEPRFASGHPAKQRDRHGNLVAAHAEPSGPPIARALWLTRCIIQNDA